MTLILSRADVTKVLDMKDCMLVVEKAFLELAEGSAIMPLRTAIRPDDGLSLYMPAFLKASEALACKVVTVYKENPAKHNLPTTIGTVLLQDPITGQVICIMDGGYLTAVRTGAASGVATQYLARKEDGMTAAIFGAGAQARCQLWAVSVARKLSKALVYDVSEVAANKFAEEMSSRLGIPVKMTSDIDEMLNGDIICTATSASTPLFDGKKVKPGTHINGIGSHSPGQRELDSEIIKRSRFIGDSREACFNEAGDIIIPVAEGVITKDHFYAELGEIIKGVKPGRENNSQITLFKSNGLAIQDAATAKLIYDKAIAAKIGINVEI